MRIFVTYSHEDRIKVEHLIEDVCDLGHNVWYDQQLTGGHVWWDDVLEQIVKSDLVMVAVSPSWLRTHSCQLELTYASALNKRILPIIISEIDHEILPDELQRLSVISYGDDQRRATRIAYAIQHLPPEAPLPNPLPLPPEAPLSELARLQQQVRAPRLTFDAQKSLVNHIRWHLYSSDLREVHQARRLLQELSERHDVTVLVKSYVDDILTSSEDIDTARLQPNATLSDSEEATNPKPLGTATVDQRRVDIAMPSEVVVGQPTQLWLQLCLPASSGFRGDLANIPHSGIVAESSPSASSRKPSTYSARRSVHVQFEITSMGLQIDEPIHDVLVPADQDAGLLTITLMPSAVIATGFVRVTAKRLVTKEKYITLGSVAVSVHIHDTTTGAYASKKWVLRSLIFASSVLFDDIVQAWGIQQARLETPPTPWSQPQTPILPDRFPNRPLPPTIQTRPLNPSHLDMTMPAIRPAIKNPDQAPVRLSSQFWLIGGVLALIMAVVIGGLVALLGNGNQAGGSRSSVAEVQASNDIPAITDSVFITPTSTHTLTSSPTTAVILPTGTAVEPAILPTTIATNLPQIRLRYTAERFTLENITGDDLNIFPLSFIGEYSIFLANEWIPFIQENTSSTLTEFPSRGCLHVILLGSTAPNSNSVIGCVRVNAYVAQANYPLPLFWHGISNHVFAIQWYGQTIAQCPAYNIANVTLAEITCEFSLP